MHDQDRVYALDSSVIQGQAQDWVEPDAELITEIWVKMEEPIARILHATSVVCRAHGVLTVFLLLQSGFGLVVWWKRRAAPASDGTTPAAW